jgi:hypothetical protein
MLTRRRYPGIESPCPGNFDMAPDQKRRWCGHCNRNVHNLDALDSRELLQLAPAAQALCVSYSVRVPLAMVMATGSAAAMASSDAGLPPNTQGDTAELLEVVVTGGVSLQREAWESLFQELEVPDSLQITDARSADGDQEPQP